jgi:hypothetical protein
MPDITAIYSAWERMFDVVDDYLEEQKETR